MKLLGSNKSKITKDKNGENVPNLKTNEVVLVHCIIVNNDYQQDLGVLYTFISKKLFDQLLGISLKDYIFLKAFNSDFSYVEVWFTDKNLKSQEIEDKINITLVYIQSLNYKKGHAIQVNLDKELGRNWVKFGKISKVKT